MWNKKHFNTSPIAPDSRHLLYHLISPFPPTPTQFYGFERRVFEGQTKGNKGAIQLKNEKGIDLFVEGI